MLHEPDCNRLRHIVEAAHEVADYVHGVTQVEFARQRTLQHSTVRCIEIIGEAASRLSPELRDSTPDIPWQDMVGMRNRLIHAYFDIDLDLVWQTATVELPAIIPRVEALLCAR